MPDRRTAWLLIPRPLRELPVDLGAVVVLTGLTIVSVFVPGIKATPLRVVFGLCFVLVLPGYAFVAALFPEAGNSPAQTPSDEESRSDQRDEKPTPVPGTDAADTLSRHEGVSQPGHEQSGIDGIERIALSFGLSIAIVPLIGLGLNFTPWGIRLAPIVLAVSAFTLGSVAVAAVRRQQLSPDERFSVPYQAWIETGRAELFEPATRTDAALNIVLVLSVLLAVGSVGYAVAVPTQGEQFTEFYLLTENTEQELVADNYPEEIERGTQAAVIVGIENNEYELKNYTVVVQLQEVEQIGNQTNVTSRQELDRFRTTLAHNETYREQHSFTPTRTGANLRVKYLLYDGDAPATPTSETAYRDLPLWIDVVEPN
jgi:uncharacterized membrane protein